MEHVIDAAELHETARATAAVAANMTTYCTGCERHSRMPKMPVTPVPEAARCVIAQIQAPTPPPMQPAMKGLKKRRLAPKTLAAE